MISYIATRKRSHWSDVVVVLNSLDISKCSLVLLCDYSALSSDKMLERHIIMAMRMVLVYNSGKRARMQNSRTINSNLTT